MQFSWRSAVDGNAALDTGSVEAAAACGIAGLADWTRLLGDVCRELQGVITSSEDEFLGIGARLHEFQRRSREIVTLAQEAAGKVTGAEINDSISGLATLLDQMNSYLMHAGKETDSSVDALKSIGSLLGGVTEPLGSFRKMNKVLRMLGTSTKIESARLGQSAIGFVTLADDVTQLSVQVQEKSETILARKGALSGIIQDTLLRVLAMEAEQQDLVRSILDKCRSSLTDLTEINNRCSAAAAVITDASAEVARNISAVVTSMQFHDIVRQQIEHVHEALTEQLQKLDAEGESCVAEGRDRLLQELALVTELQVAQLRFAGEELVNAITTISTNLDGIASMELHMSDDTRAMSGMADQAGSTFFAEMEQDISIVSLTLVESATANRKLADAVGSVAETVAEISHFVNDIEDIGQEIELIALNAQIKSACTGCDGAALGVLAEAIQRLSVDAMQQTEAISGALRGITDVTETLNQGVVSEASSLDQEVHGMTAELGGLVQQLSRVNSSLVSLLGRMDSMVQELSVDIKRLIGSITVQQTLPATVEGLVALLQRLIDEAKELAPIVAGSPAEKHLQDLASRYTMHSERRIHAAVTNGVQDPSATVTTVASALQEDDETGDNFELF